MSESEENQNFGMEPVSDKERLSQDMKLLDMMAKWRKKLSKGEYIKIKVSDKGMAPTINMGDLVEVVPVQTSSLKSGALVFFRQNDKFMVRRIIETIYSGKGEFKVKGDNQTEPEPIVPAGNILGKVVAVERDGQKIELEKSLASTLNQLNKKFGGSDSAKATIEMEKGKQALLAFFQKILDLIEKMQYSITKFVDDCFSKMFKK